MGVFNILFGRKTSIQEGKKIVITKAIEEVLGNLKSSNPVDRMMAMTEASKLLGQQEPGALKPYLLALKDEDVMVKGAAVSLLAEASFDRIIKPVFRSVVKESEDRHQLLDLLKDMSEKDSEYCNREDAKRALYNINRCLEE